MRLFLFVDDAKAVVVAKRNHKVGEFVIGNTRAKLAIHGVGSGLPEREAINLLDGLGKLRRIEQCAFDLVGIAF